MIERMLNFEKNFYLAASIFALTILIVSGVLWQVLLTPLIEAKEEYKNNKTVILQLERKLDLSSELKKEFESITDNVNNIKKSVLASNDTLIFIEKLEEAGTNSQNTLLVKVAQEIVDEEGKVTEINFDVTLDGSYNNLLSFLQELKKLPYLLSISNISISKLQQGEEFILRSDIAIKVFIN